MAAKVEGDESHDFKKLFSPFWFFLYYLMGYPLRVLGCFLDGFVIYWLVYDVRESNGQAWFAAIVGAVLIQVVLGLSTTVSAKNLFRGLLFRSVAYSMMFLITAVFAGGSLYSTLYLSRHGSGYAVESFSPKLKPITTETVRAKSNEAVNILVGQQTQEIIQLTKANNEAKAALNEQIRMIGKTIKKYQRIVNSYADGVPVPWENRSPIITGQKTLKKLNAELLNLTTKHQDNLAATRSRQNEERMLARKAGLETIAEVKTVNQQKVQKLDVYGLLAIGGNVGINVLSFLIMLGYELFVKFSGDENPSKTRNQQKTPTQAEAQQTDKSAKKPVAQKTQKEETGTKTQYFPYVRHRKNARMSYARSFYAVRDAETTHNRMGTAQQHINALLWHGFDVRVMATDQQRLEVDPLSAPTLEKKRWECVVVLNEKAIPTLKKFKII